MDFIRGVTLAGLAAVLIGVQAAEVVPDSDCLDCHGQDDLVKTNAAGRTIALYVDPSQLAASAHRTNLCATCHTDITRQHPDDGVAARPVDCARCHPGEAESYDLSVHGNALRRGDADAATCRDCHGAHRILPETDPRSSIHNDHRVATCGQCHAGAPPNFAFGRIHVASGGEEELGARINRWVRSIYRVLIAVTIGAMLAHNAIVWWRKALAARRAAGRTIERLSRSQRRQHWVLLASFVVLALTGFALKYPKAWPFWVLGGHLDFGRWLHRGAGVALLLVGAYHLWYVCAREEGRRLLRELLPRWADVRAAGRVCCGAGGNESRPKAGRFGYVEKVEYWAVLWGTAIMGVTGLAIWFEIELTRVVPRWVVEVAGTVHYYEAVLACLAIVVWHLYHVIFDPDVYPMNWAWLDGKAPGPRHEIERPGDGAVRDTPTDAGPGTPPAGAP